MAQCVKHPASTPGVPGSNPCAAKLEQRYIRFSYKMNLFTVALGLKSFDRKTC